MFKNNFSSYIRIGMHFRRTAYLSGALLFLLILTILYPIYLVPAETEATTKNANPATLTFAFTDNKNTASVSVQVSDKNGEFATSSEAQKASFSLSTNNATGYTLNLKTSTATTTLSDGTHSIPTIDDTKTASNFANNTYGILPSKYNGTANTTNYYPASSTGFKMDETSAANSTANTYTIGLGIKANYAATAGTYTTANTDNGNTGASLVLEYVANAVTYSINYYTNTSDTVTGMPSVNPQTGTVAQGTTSTSVNLASAPSRTGYTFKSWCLGTSASSSNITVKTDGTSDICNSTTYDAGQSFGIDATKSPDTYYLFAMWQRNSYTCTKQYRFQGADGNFPSNYTVDTSATEQVLYGNTCSYSKTDSDYKDSASGTNGSTVSTSGTMTENGLTLSLDLYRNTYTLAVSAGSNTSNPTGGGTKKWGETVTVSVTKAANVTCTTYAAPNWTQNASGIIGATSNNGNTYYMSYTMPKSGATVTAASDSTAVQQTINLSRSNASSITINGTAYTGGSTTLTCGTYNISGAYPTGYSFSSWGVANGVAVNNASSASTTMTVSGPGTLTLNGKVNQYTCTKRYRLQNGDGSWGSYTTESTPSMNYNSTCSYSKTVTDYKNSASGTNGAQASGSCTVGTSGCTVSLDFYRNTYTLTVNRNTTYISGASASTAAVHGSNYYRWGQSISISATPAEYSAFNGWSVSSGSSGSFASTSNASTTYTMPKGNSTIYANGKDSPPGYCTSSATCMQAFNNATCQSTASSSAKTLTDARDGKTYTVRWVNGHCWMTQNLRITGTISSTYSNFHTNSTFNPCSNEGTIYDPYCVDSGSTTNGIYYNYVAASAGTVTEYNDANEATEDICPKGWKLPSESEAANTFGEYSSTYVSAFNAVYSGHRGPGGVSDVGTSGFWWTSTPTPDRDDCRNQLGYNSGNMYTGNFFACRHTWSLTIRCMRAS